MVRIFVFFQVFEQKPQIQYGPVNQVINFSTKAVCVCTYSIENGYSISGRNHRSGEVRFFFDR